MIETQEQCERAEKAMGNMQRCLLVARHIHTREASTALSAPILRELQERERDMLASLSRSPEVVAGHEG